MAPKPPVTTWSVFALWALATCMWVGTLSGLASLQERCETNPTLGFQNSGNLSGVRGFSATQLPCYAVHRYYWAILALQLAVLCGLAVSLMAGCVSCLRTPLVGLFAVATALFCQMTDSYLALEGVAYYTDGQPLHRARTMGAGCVATCVLNLMLIVAIGSDWDSCTGCKSGGAKAQTAAGGVAQPEEAA